MTRHSERPFTRLDNALYAHYWKTLSLAEKAVLITVLRLLIGFQKEQDAISIGQIADNAGLARNTVRAGIEGLLNCGVLIEVAPATARRAAVLRIAYPALESEQPTADEQPAPAIPATAATIASEQQSRPTAQDAPNSQQPPVSAGVQPARTQRNGQKALYKALYDAVHELVFDYDTEIPEGRIGKLTNALLRMNCTVDELRKTLYHFIKHHPTAETPRGIDTLTDAIGHYRSDVQKDNAERERGRRQMEQHQAAMRESMGLPPVTDEQQPAPATPATAQDAPNSEQPTALSTAFMLQAIRKQTSLDDSYISEHIPGFIAWCEKHKPETTITRENVSRLWHDFFNELIPF